ncbi:Muskelin N-terminus-domain-containing protein [Chlamydoabsidia padenii]|nr:Muskelin N-terminus-domain-containing protein [Chlamydoabsidia padenii]
MPKRRNSHRSSELGALLSKSTSIPLRYSIYDYSSYSGTYHPNNIYFNTPQNQSSRWSSGSHDGTQYITIRFDQPVIARALLWGKFHRSHVCNVKEFKVYGGMDPTNMTELLSQALQNHNKPEVFRLRCIYQNLVIPIQYIKIVPISTFSTNFNYSIWYLELLGIDNPDITCRVMNEYENYKEKEAIRLCMKYFRQRDMGDVFQLIKQRTGVELENPILTRLHTALVKEGNFELAESLVEQVDAQYNIFQSFTQKTKYQPIWQQLHPTPNSDGDVPCGRSGHQMCINSSDGLIYLHGGWTGKSSLADFWSYSIKENRWCLISDNTSKQNGPSASSCHQICFDPSSRSVFVFGRVVDSRSETVNAINFLQADFYRYFIDTDRWEKLDDHTAANGGPELVFDHQMCVDAASGILYVFGGRAVSGNNIHQYSNLYSYDIKRCTWKLIRNDMNQPHDDGSPPTPISSSSSSSSSANSSTSNSPTPSIHHRPLHHVRVPLQSRVGHSMLMDSQNQQIYIFGGERADNWLNDLHQYNISTDAVSRIVSQQYRKHLKKKHQRQSSGHEWDGMVFPSFQHGSNGENFEGVDIDDSSNSDLGNDDKTSSDDDDDDDDGDNDDDITTMLTEDDNLLQPGFDSFYNHRRNDNGRLSMSGSELEYTQNATIDMESRQIRLFSGYLRNTGCKTVTNVLRIYHLDRNVWEEVYTNERCHQSSTSPSLPLRPAVVDCPTPRFSCQWIYDDTTKTHFLFGGDPHEYTDSDKRLGDFWKLKLVKPDVDSITQRYKYLIRAQKFKELCYKIEKNKNLDQIPQVLDYLQTQVTPLVNDEERVTLGRLCTRLCLLGDEDRTGGRSRSPFLQQSSGNETTPLLMFLILIFFILIDTFYSDRTHVYNELLEYFPADMREPMGDISDALQI